MDLSHMKNAATAKGMAGSRECIEIFGLPKRRDQNG